MEQHLEATYLRPGMVERGAAIGLVAVGIGTAILLASWGISFLWRYVPPETTVRIANPELHVTQKAPFLVTQDKPFVLAQPEPFKIDAADVTIRVDQPPLQLPNSAEKTPAGDVIRREVTVFSNVKHGAGAIVTGWKYKDGRGGSPVAQFCHYIVPNADYSSTRIDIASNRTRLPLVDAALVPDLEGALAKCQWWP
jgi:hypothetical protein